MKKEELVVPFIHLNGTGRQNLLDQINDVLSAIDHLLEMMGNAAPHGRDYYPVEGERGGGRHTMRGANTQHYSRMNRVLEVQDEYVMILRILMEGEG